MKKKANNLDLVKTFRRLTEFEITNEGWKSVPDFTHWIIEEYKVTTTGKAITANWVHFRINEKKLPQAMGGNVISVGVLGNVKFVKISDKTYKPKAKGRKEGSKNKPKVLIGGKKVLLRQIRKGQ